MHVTEARHAVPARCPVCATAMYVERVRCDQCGSAVEGRFHLDWPAQLSKEQLSFAKVFLVSRGKIKDVEQALGISYPTVVSRLDEVVEALSGEREPGERSDAETARRLKVLARLARGELDVDAAERALREDEE